MNSNSIVTNITREIGITGILGFDYNILKNLSVSMESQMLNTFYYKTDNYTDHTVGFPVDGDGTYFEKYFYETTLKPFAKLTLNYQF